MTKSSPAPSLGTLVKPLRTAPRASMYVERVAACRLCLKHSVRPAATDRVVGRVTRTRKQRMPSATCLVAARTLSATSMTRGLRKKRRSRERRFDWYVQAHGPAPRARLASVCPRTFTLVARRCQALAEAFKSKIPAERPPQAHSTGDSTERTAASEADEGAIERPDECKTQ